MAYQVVGYERKKGEYQGRAYDNMKFYFMEETDPEEVSGLQGNRVLVESGKYEYFKDKLPTIGSRCNLYYNKFAKIEAIVPIK